MRKGLRLLQREAASKKGPESRTGVAPHLGGIIRDPTGTLRGDRRVGGEAAVSTGWGSSFNITMSDVEGV